MSQKKATKALSGGNSPLLQEVANLLVPVTLLLSAKGLSFISTRFETKAAPAASNAKNTNTKPTKK